MAIRDIVDQHIAGLELRGVYLPILCSVLVVAWLARNFLTGGLNKVPGPLINSLSVIPRLWSVYRGNSHWDDFALHQKYGKVVRIAPNKVSISTVEQLDHLYGITSKLFKSGFYEGARFYDEEGLVPDPFVLADKTMHSRMKRNAAKAYSLQALVQLEPLVDGIIDRLFARLDQNYAATGKQCDIGEYMLFFSMDAIFTITYGSDMGFINKGDDNGFLKLLQDGLMYLSCIGQVPWAHRFLRGNSWVSKLLESTGSSSLMDDAMTLAINQRTLAEQAIRKSEDDGNAPCTFLMRLLRNQASNPSSITDREINTHTFGNIIAGGDTTATALRAVLRDLIRHPDVLERLLAHLKAAGLTSGDKPVPYATASKITYLTAVIRESMRIHPSVAMILARGLPAGGVTVTDGAGGLYHLGEDTEVGINPWIVQRDPDVFPNPEIYSPARWLESSPEQLTMMNRAWIPFGAGRHTCSGQHISMMEITKLIPSLILRYSMALEKGAPDWSVTTYFLAIQKGLRVNMQLRHHKPSS